MSFNNSLTFSIFLFRNRVPLNNWWLVVRPLLRVLARHRETFIREVDE